AIYRSLSFHLDSIILDHGIGQQLVGGSFQRRFRAGAIGARQFDIEHLALPDAGDAVDAQRSQRAFDGLALRIEDARLERNGDARLPCLFPRPLTSTGPEPAGRSFSIRMPKRLATSV